MLAPLKVDTYNYNQTKTRARIEFRTDNYCMNENIGIGCGMILHNFVRVLVDCSTEAEPKICKSKFQLEEGQSSSPPSASCILLASIQNPM